MRLTNGPLLTVADGRPQWSDEVSVTDDDIAVHHWARPEAIGTIMAPREAWKTFALSRMRPSILPSRVCRHARCHDCSSRAAATATMSTELGKEVFA